MDIMEIKELVSYSVNETTQTLDVTFRLIVAELCIISASFSPVNTNPAPPISAAN
jgi:hypothetical protein